MPGPPRQRSASARKKYIAEYSKGRRSQSICIGLEIDRWKELKEELGVKTHCEVAKTLLDRYKEFPHKRKKLAIPETVADTSESGSSHSEVVMSGVEPLPSTSDSEINLPGPSKKKKAKGPVSTSTPITTQPQKSDSELSALSAVEAEIIKASVDEGQNIKSNEQQNRSFSVRFEDTDDNEVIGMTMIDDPNDLTFEPEMSINLPRPVDLIEESLAEEVDLEKEVIDLEEPVEEDLNEDDVGKNRLSAYTNSEERDGFLLVSEKSIMALANLIPVKCTRKGCKENVMISSRKVATGIIINWTCTSKHDCLSWASQPFLPNGVMVGNFKLSAAIVLSGNNFTKVSLMAKFLRLGFPSSSMFDRIQGQYIIPEVNRYWLTVKASMQEEYRATSIVVAGDGRMDSPGHSAKFCTYTIMNQADKKIVAMEVVDKREVQLKSGRLEEKGFRKALQDIISAGIEVKEIVTDAHPTISSIMRKEYPNTRHSWDMWHGAKNLGKKLHGVAQEKGNARLKPWIQDITNHFFYSAETCNEDRDFLQMKFVSVLNHTLNVHKWALGRCDHEEIDETSMRNKEWLEPDSQEIVGLEKVIMDPRFQSNLGHYVTCQTTSEIESFNNHLLMYVSKRHAFTYASYKCRCQLAAIDYMHHLDRPLRKNKKGEFYYCRTFSKAANHWGFKYVKVPKDYSYIADMMVAIISAYCENYKDKPLRQKRAKADDDPRLIAPTIALEAPPPTRQLVEEKQSRLQGKGFQKPMDM